MFIKSKVFSLWLLTVLMLNSGICLAEEEITVSLDNEIDITVEQFPAGGKYLLLWMAPEYGLRSGHRSLSRKLSEHNVEVWLTNLLESLFLPQSTQSIKQLDSNYIADLIEYAHKKSGKKIVVAGDSYAAISALMGANQWQQRKLSESYLVGAILFTPYTYAYIPPLGLEPEYMPIVSATNIPLMIYQAEKSGTTGQFKELVEKLQQHENPVYTKFIPGAMSVFYNQEVTPESNAQVKSLPGNIKKMIAVLDKHEFPPQAIATKNMNNSRSGIDIFLKEFQGNKTPLAINLKDVNGDTVVKKDYTGQVTVVNFWATWCPPCVQEIPSLNRLKTKMSKFPFELISINYAEDTQTIKDFMKEVNVEFPVLLDQEGKFAQQWNVITYPSTFVIDPQGKIKYGVNAAIEWDEPEFIRTLEALYKTSDN